jgi:transcriptional regulator with XRE-family HTH domain
MDLVEWLRQVREGRGIDLRSIANEAKLNASTVSRIERGLTDPAMSTIVRITHAMGLKPEDFLRSTQAMRERDQKRGDRGVIGVLTLEDVIRLEDYIRKNPTGLNEIQARITEEFRPEAEYFASFQSDGITRLLRGSPLYNFNLSYPFYDEVSITADGIFDILMEGGIIIRHDAAAYLSLRAGEKVMRPIGSRNEMRILALRQTSIYDKGKREPNLSELLHADDYLSDNCELLLITWAAYEYERTAKLRFMGAGDMREMPGQWWNLHHLEYGYPMIVLTRWLEALRLPKDEWLARIRREIDQGQRNRRS